MNIFWRLVLAHLLTDFTLQTNFIASWKRENIWGGLVHSIIFFVSGAAICWESLHSIWFNLGNVVILNGWAAIAILTFFHFLEDEWRVWTIKKLNSPDSFVFFLWDQCIHYVLIFVFSPQYANAYPEKIILYAILFILTTHFTSIFVFYMEKGIYGQAMLPGREKYYSIAERTVAGLLLLLPGLQALNILFLVPIRIIVHRIWKDHGFSWVNVVVGSIMGIVFGLFARLIYYA